MASVARDQDAAQSSKLTQSGSMEKSQSLAGSWVVEDQLEDELEERLAEAEANDSTYDDASSVSFDSEPKDSKEVPLMPQTPPLKRSQLSVPAATPSQSKQIEQEFFMPSPDHSYSAPKEAKRRKATPKATKKNPESPPKAQKRQKRAPQSKSARETSARDVSRAGAMALDFTQASIGYLFEVLAQGLRLVKTPLAYLLALFILGALLDRAWRGVLTPICGIPGAPFLRLPFCQPQSMDGYQGGPSATAAPLLEFDRLMSAQSKFEEILDASASGVSLPADMKRSEASIRDLRSLVRYSTLQSRHELVLEFDGFVDTARLASQDLARFNSRVGRAVDNVINTARWTQRVLGEIEEDEGGRSPSVLAGVPVVGGLLSLFATPKLTSEVLLAQYLRHADAVEGEIARLVAEAQALLLVLQNLDDRLDVIHAISLRDEHTAAVRRDELLGQLWTRLGGNRRDVARHDGHLALLGRVADYRRAAWAHVSATILKLQAMSAELEELRERLGQTGLLADRPDVPLSVHLANVQSGVERLEISRDTARRAQNAYLQKALGPRGDDDGDEKPPQIGSV